MNAERKEPERCEVQVIPEVIDERAAWRKQKVRTLVLIHKLIEENGQPFAELRIAGWPEKVHRSQNIFPAKFHPLRNRDVFIAKVNVRAEHTRDIEIEFEAASANG